ncbi:hypothetical protein L1049_006660 [Liquidambar formosana]|uniref:F-box domain-containing protein n=1 Tax=Liquidambar formosana TaxID=63359 RepID=A0AAP0WU11_LIQFO
MKRGRKKALGEGIAMKRRKATEIQIPPDVLRDVLAKLPAKSLMRFKCVSKFWCALIRDPCFVELHRTRSKTRPGGTSLIISLTTDTVCEKYFFFANHEGEPASHQRAVAIPTYDEASHQRTRATPVFCWGVSQVLNGLVCVIKFGHVQHSATDRVSVCNLSTHEITTLPASSPKRSSYVSGYLFGCDPLAKYYKVLKLCTTAKLICGRHKNYHRENVTRCEVFTLGGGTTSWKTIDPLLYQFHYHCSFWIRSVCINGTIYWIRKSNFNGKIAIGTFDVMEEKIGVISLPENASPQSSPIQVGGRLALVDREVWTRPYHNIKLWILEDYDNQIWTQETIVIPRHETTLGRPLPIGTICGSGEILLVESKFSLPLRWLYYHQERREAREIEVPLLSVSENEVGFQNWPRLSRATHKNLKRNLRRLWITDHVENIFPLSS